MAMPFNDDQISQFKTEGWIAVPDFWTQEEVTAMQSELDRLKKEGKLRNVATEGDGRTYSETKSNLQLCPLWPHNDFFRAMPLAPKVAEAVGQLIGKPVILHLDQVFLKPAKHGVVTNWHQDNAYFKIPDPLQGTALWTAVHEATTANGTMRIIPRAFHALMEHTRDVESDHHIRCWPDENKLVTVELPAGGALFFAYGTPHCTGANTTEKERAGVALHFIRADVTGSVPGGFAAGHPALLNESSDKHLWESAVRSASRSPISD